MKLIISTAPGAGFCTDSIPSFVLDKYATERCPNATLYRYKWTTNQYCRVGDDECPDDGEPVWFTNDVGKRVNGIDLTDDDFFILSDNARYDPVLVKLFEEYMERSRTSEWAVIEVPDEYCVVVVDNGEGVENAFWSASPIESTTHTLLSTHN